MNTTPPESHRAIRFVYQGQIRQVEHVSPTLSVLEWLRTHERRIGTKEGCAEGDCGACTVMVAEWADVPDSPHAGAAQEPQTARVGPLRLRPINACIRFLPTLDGKALLTVEDLAQPSGLHPAQQAMVDCHASQCGFCTPGFVMSLAACHEHHSEAQTRPQRQDLADALSGNLCRCTGYRPILDAAQRMFEVPNGSRQRMKLDAVAAQLQCLREDPPLRYCGPNADGSGAAQSFEAPRTAQALAKALQEKPTARLLAGCTDIGLWVNKQFRPLGEIVYLGDVAELRAIVTAPDGSLHIGAGVSLEDAWSAIVRRWPAFKEMWLRFAGPPVRHAGTLAGNLANGSPIGDGAPALMSLDARLLLRHGNATREVSLDNFYLDYMKNLLQPGEWVQTVIIPAQPVARQWHAWKISKRFDCDISSLCVAFALELQGDVVHEVRMVFGGMAATVKRAWAAEAVLRGRPWTEATLNAAQAALAQDFTPLSDLRATASYRMDAAQGLLRRWWLQTRPAQALPAEATTVWLRPGALPQPAPSGVSP